MGRKRQRRRGLDRSLPLASAGAESFRRSERGPVRSGKGFPSHDEKRSAGVTVCRQQPHLNSHSGRSEAIQISQEPSL